MNNTQEQIRFTVNIVLGNDDEANFTYSIDGKEVTGGGVVRTKTAGVYTQYTAIHSLQTIQTEVQTRVSENPSRHRVLFDAR